MQKPWVSDFTEILKTHGIWHVVLSFDSPHNSVCKTFLQNKEEDARRKRTDEYSGKFILARCIFRIEVLLFLPPVHSHAQS